MKRSRIALLVLALLIVGQPRVMVGQDAATPQEVVAKVREAARTLSQTGDLAQFERNKSPWVWKDSYVFVGDCDKRVLAAHPMRPDLIGESMATARDARGKSLYPDPAGFCNAARKPSGVWIEYWWAKPGAKEGSRKVSYYLAAKGTPYVVGAGVYDDKSTIAELSKLTTMK